MRKLILLAAASAGILGGSAVVATPSFAAPLLCNPYAHQLECALNFEWKAGTTQTTTTSQKIILKGHHTDEGDLHGLLQLQLAGNVAVKAGGTQTINQDQTLYVRDDAYGNHGTPQVQVGLNVEYKANVDQTINQTQTIDTKGDVGGSVQNQTALNIAVESHGGSQTISQTQSITHE